MQHKDPEFSFKSLFVPLTTLKAVHWIVIIGLIVFANMLLNGFVWDDITYIVNNPEVHTFHLISYFGRTSFNTYGQYRPFIEIYFATLYALFTNHPFFYHVIQLVIHMANTIFVFILLRKFLNSQIAFFLSLIFLVHPMQVEAVSYISPADDPLYFFFGMSAFFVSMSKQLTVRKVSLISFFLLISVLFKETGFLFIAVILFHTILFSRKRILSIILSVGITSTAYFLLRFGVAKEFFSHINQPLKPILALPFFERLINIPAILFYYIKTFFYPSQLAIDQLWIVTKIDIQNFFMPLIFSSLFFLILISIGVLFFLKHKNVSASYAFFFFWFVLGIGLHTQLIPIDMTVADRYFYFPMVGVLGMLGLILEEVVYKKKATFLSYFTVAFLILFLLSVRTIIRNANWYDTITLYTHDSRIVDNYDIEAYLGVAYATSNQYKQAVNHLTKSVSLFPYESNIFDLAEAYGGLGDNKLAIFYFFKALHSQNYYFTTTHKHDLQTYVTLIWYLIRTGSYVDYNKTIALAFADYPNNPFLWEEVAIYQYELHHQNQALLSIGKAIDISQNQEFITIQLLIKNHKNLHLALFPTFTSPAISPNGI